MQVAERYKTVLNYFAQAMPNADTELVFSNEFELLVAVVLSAQCTDKRVNMVTPPLFRRWPTPQAMAQASYDDVQQMIASVSYPNSKCRYLVDLSKKICSDFNGKVPRTREELMSLPGVGRKTANVMLIVAFGVPAMPVDTHVFRVTARLGLTVGCKNPEQTERRLVENIEPNLLHKAHHWFILFGRYTCTAISPKCDVCPFISFCLEHNPNSLENDEDCQLSLEM